jgi:hypothetical protein
VRPAVFAAAISVSGCWGIGASCPDIPPVDSGRYVGTIEQPALGAFVIDDGRVDVEVDRDADLVVVSFASEGRTVQQRYRIVTAP